MKKIAVSAAIVAALAMAGIQPRRTVEVKRDEQTEEEAQRRIQAAADRRAKRNAKHKGE